MFRDLGLSVEDKVLRSSMFLSSGWAWKSRGSKAEPSTFLFHGWRLCSPHQLPKVTQEEGTPPTCVRLRGSQ